MLILVRKIGQGFHIGADVEVKVLGLEYGRVKIGIQAPSGQDVLRSELWDSGQRGYHRFPGQHEAEPCESP